jgi:hypothetical protein
MINIFEPRPSRDAGRISVDDKGCIFVDVFIDGGSLKTRGNLNDDDVRDVVREATSVKKRV